MTYLEAIEHGIDFLAQQQLASGEFPTLAGAGVAMREPYHYGSPFITTFVLYALRNLSHPVLAMMRQKALDFLTAEQEPGGIWRNHTRNNPCHRRQRLPPDLDDISTVSHILQYYGRPFEDNRVLIRNNRTEEGLFQTWIAPPFQNEIDAVVNANVLLYLGEEIDLVCTYLNQVIDRQMPFSRWYPDRLAFFYMAARAFENGISGLIESRQVIVADVRRRLEGGFGNDLQTALALNVLQTFGVNDDLVEAGIVHLLHRQNPAGGWQLAPLFNGFKMYYGSVALTTALAIEALAKYHA